MRGKRSSLNRQAKARRERRSIAEKEVEKIALLEEGVQAVFLKGMDEGAGIELARDLLSLASILCGVGFGTVGRVNGAGDDFDAFAATEVSAFKG